MSTVATPSTEESPDQTAPNASHGQAGHEGSHGETSGVPAVKQFKRDAHEMTHDLRHREIIQKALGGYYVKRDEQKAKFTSWPEARQAAAEVKWETLNHLDKYLDQFAQGIASRGAHVHWAANAEEGRAIILDICKRHGARIIKSKTMTSEEIHLNDALEEAGYEVVESDLGEYIMQLKDEAPYHFVFPSMHLTRGEVSQIFQEKLGTEPADTPEELTMIARRVMREKYLRADIGITGANFAIAREGCFSITENEGNARLTMSLPRVHIALVGIEKVLPTLDDLALFLPLLATAGAGQPLTGYNTMVFGPRRDEECDGPEELHVVLLDNGRTNLLADPEQRDALHCIRCGACLNVCPIFKNVGGHSYGTTYQGPIGSVITPHLRGLQEWKHLSGASSLCGACTEACPVKIDLAHHLLQNRRNAVREKPVKLEQLAWKAFAFLMGKPSLYKLAVKLGRTFQPLHVLVKGRPVDPLLIWTKTREFPDLAKKSFHEQWAVEQKKEAGK